MAKEKLFHVGLKALIENDKREVLILHADTNYGHRGVEESYWDLAGGRIQIGQNPIEALKREVQEETGITQIDNIKLLTAVISNHQIPLEDGMVVGLALMIYEVKVPNSIRIVLSPEHDKYEWVSKELAAKRLANKYPLESTEFMRAL